MDLAKLGAETRI